MNFENVEHQHHRFNHPLTTPQFNTNTLTLVHAIAIDRYLKFATPVAAIDRPDAVITAQQQGTIPIRGYKSPKTNVSIPPHFLWTLNFISTSILQFHHRSLFSGLLLVGSSIDTSLQRDFLFAFVKPFGLRLIHRRVSFKYLGSQLQRES